MFISTVVDAVLFHWGGIKVGEYTPFLIFPVKLDRLVVFLLHEIGYAKVLIKELSLY